MRMYVLFDQPPDGELVIMQINCCFSIAVEKQTLSLFHGDSHCPLDLYHFTFVILSIFYLYIHTPYQLILNQAQIDNLI